MNKTVIAFDTSNYTTSAALFDGVSPVSSRKLLPVGPGEKGLRQNDAVFFHVKQLPAVVEGLGGPFCVSAVGCSDRPRDLPDSYMPCFSVGSGFARGLSSLLGVPLHVFSHQQGHIAAALWSAGKLSLIKDKFCAFHLSGGTLEAVAVSPDPYRIISTSVIAATSDLSAGQVIDRVGVMLGLDFPCGKELEKLALSSVKRYAPKTCVKKASVCLSGLENICTKMYNEGAAPEDVARFCFDYIGLSLRMLSGQVSETGKKTVYCGGVASNSIIREYLDGPDAVFSTPELSTDNAVGTAVLTAIAEGMI